MKLTILKNILTGTFAALALVAFSVPAEQIKGAQRLMKQAPSTDAMAAAPAKSHDCATCQDVTKEVKFVSSKGAGVKTALVNRHTCPTCDTRLLTAGQGKAAHTVAVHICASGATPNCCK
ncbi:MAG TPA: hypothetical protein VKY92_25620 [Verrucomicrobiae bacterium]|nr:hypothetical protein [Verrucomicrobiae bacterium]